MIIQPNVKNAIEQVKAYRNSYASRGVVTGTYAWTAIGQYMNIYANTASIQTFGSNISINNRQDQVDTIAEVYKSNELTEAEKNEIASKASNLYKEMWTATQYVDPRSLLSGLALEKYNLLNNPNWAAQYVLRSIYDFKNNRGLFLQNRDYSQNVSDREFLITAYNRLIEVKNYVDRQLFLINQPHLDVKQVELSVLTQNEYNYILAYQAANPVGGIQAGFNKLVDDLAAAGSFVTDNVMSQELAKTIEVVSVAAGVATIVVTGAAVLAGPSALTMSEVFSGATATIASTASEVKDYFSPVTEPVNDFLDIDLGGGNTIGDALTGGSKNTDSSGGIISGGAKLTEEKKSDNSFLIIGGSVLTVLLALLF